MYRTSQREFPVQSFIFETMREAVAETGACDMSMPDVLEGAPSVDQNLTEQVD